MRTGCYCVLRCGALLHCTSHSGVNVRQVFGSDLWQLGDDRIVLAQHSEQAAPHMICRQTLETEDKQQGIGV